MDELEQELRDLLSRRAQAAPAGHQVLSAVRRNVVRRRRRRRALAGGVATAVALATLGTAVLADRLAAPPALRMGAAPATAGRGDGGSTAPAVVFVPGSPVDVTFPFTSKPPLLGDLRPVLSLVAGRPTLEYLSPDPPASVTPSPPGSASTPPAPPTSTRAPQDAPAQNAAGSGLAALGAAGSGGAGAAIDKLLSPDSDPVTVVAADSPWTDGPFTPTTAATKTVVEGHLAVMGERRTAGGTDHVLSWTQRPGLWVGISMPTKVPDKLLTEYADSLVEAPITEPGPFDFDLVPAGFGVDNVSRAAVTFDPPGVEASLGYPGKIVVMADAGPQGAGSGQSLTVDGRPAWLHTDAGVTMLNVDEGAGWGITIQLPANLGVTEPDLLRFAAGVHLTADATPSRG
ncbi:hypothetical protein GCM10023322_61970 [Rugosimonospora acidiphila]|uniref:Uncharacterized protein n=1 Tax=Rugosimonospora acidiphila TaxID=556531 RepID=A0ABP9SI17_9ACTN